jgi:small ligand-binding sensory domain FIST
VGNDNQAYFLQRAAEETAAAERATSEAAAHAHRELSLRYSLKMILPERSEASEDARVIGLPKPRLLPAVQAPPRRRSAKRRTA